MRLVTLMSTGVSFCTRLCGYKLGVLSGADYLDHIAFSGPEGHSGVGLAEALDIAFGRQLTEA